MAKHVLIIDDSLAETRALKSLLELNGYQVSIATNGQEGIETAQNEKPDVIVMDVVMPLVNGFQATRALSRNKLTNHIPIIVCSSKATESDRLWALRQGAKEYLTKPVKFQSLLKVITDQITGARVNDQSV
ncbi:response regulator [Thiolinea disciformis]|uniref:response regulator n=1 Tax=Thiolinea disciformis TaxID=125614 RepID=UPI000378EA4F|nr:response regulator [Thiolinea disciformis]